jgi:hypothetical protein
MPPLDPSAASSVVMRDMTRLETGAAKSRREECTGSRSHERRLSGSLWAGTQTTLSPTRAKCAGTHTMPVCGS